MAYNKETAKAIQCAGQLLELCVSDPDPKAREKYQKEFNCENCDAYVICHTVLESVKKII